MKNTNTDKLAEAERNYNWYSKPLKFDKMVGQSAKGILGGGWKKHFGTNELFSYSEMDGMKPYDMNVACIKTSNQRAFSPGDEVQLQVNAGDKRYGGTHKIVGINGDFLILPLAMTGGASGTILNTSRQMKHKQECLRWSNAAQKGAPAQKVRDKPGNGKGSGIDPNTPQQSDAQPIRDDITADNNTSTKDEALDKKKKIIKGVLITLGAAVVLYAGYKGYKYLQKSKVKK